MAQGRGDYGTAFTSKVLIFLPHFSRIKRRIFPFTGGRDHLAHRLMRKGLSKRNTAFALWAMQKVRAHCLYSDGSYHCDWVDLVGSLCVVLADTKY